MKTAFLILCLLLTTAAFGQHSGASRSNQAQPYQPPSHPEEATVHALATEHYVLSGRSYTSAQGERPAWDLPQAPPAPSLGETARILREQHARVKKARCVLEN
jgi:hypothetical protein